MNSRHQALSADRQLEMTIRRIRTFNIRTATLLKSDEFEMFIKTCVLLAAFIIGVQFSS